MLMCNPEVPGRIIVGSLLSIGTAKAFQPATGPPTAG
jgi:hypothetical protein